MVLILVFHKITVYARKFSQLFIMIIKILIMKVRK